MPVVKAEPPLALAEVVGSVSDRPLLDRAFHNPSVVDRPLARVMEPPLADHGHGRDGRGLAARLQHAAPWSCSTTVTPIGILTRSDLLDFLVQRRPTSPPRERRSSGSRPMAIHAGQTTDPTTGAVVTPIYQTSTFAQPEVGVHQGYEYSRSGNPTRTALETCVAALEGGHLRTGLRQRAGRLRRRVAAVCEPGDHVLIGNDAYGGTYRLAAQVHCPAGSPSPLSRWTTWKARGLHGGRPPAGLGGDAHQPAAPFADIAAVAELAHARGALVAVDNTFATPYLQRPLAHGADIVVHSTTKYLGGHSDVVGGFVATSTRPWPSRLAFLQNAAGAVPGPFDCFLALRGIKTLAVRMDRHCDNAAAVSDAAGQPPGRRAHVYFPGLPATSDMPRPGPDAGLRWHGLLHRPRGRGRGHRRCHSTRIFTLAESLGAVESLIEHPHRMTHASLVDSPLAVDPALLRLSVGLELEADLVDDLRQALDAAPGRPA